MRRLWIILLLTSAACFAQVAGGSLVVGGSTNRLRYRA